MRSLLSWGRVSLLTSGTIAVVWATSLGGANLPAPEDAFQYRVLAVTGTGPGQTPAVTFEVTNPLNGGYRYDILADAPFLSTANGASRLFVQIAWDTRDYTNTGSGSHLAPVAAAAALPIAINALTTAQKNADLSFTVRAARPVPSTARGTGTAVIEGHPAVDVDGDGVLDRLPVKSAYLHFTITDPAVVPRRAAVDIQKCKQCHQPHLSLHGNNRTDEPQVCVTCHNPNATDIAYRTSGAETPIDFKHMVHAIHAGGMRRSPFVVIGFGGSVNDFSTVRFPRPLADCQACHVAGAYGLPLAAGVLGTTISTGSVYGPPKVVDGDPANDRNITPIAAVCSACHDSAEDRRHMTQTGRASFSALQADIDSGRVRERCATCHGRGKSEDVVRVHADEMDDDN